jgi:hypothetical protein
MVDILYWKQMVRTRKSLGDTILAPFLVLVFIFFYAMSSPQNYQQTGFLFFYPLYTDYTIQCFYTTGTWLWVFTICWIMAAIANQKFSEYGYKIFTGSALYAYVSHYFFIIMIAVLIIRPYKLEFLESLILEVFLTNAIILISYIIFTFIWELFVPPKKMELKDQGTEEEREALLKQEVKAAEVRNR